MGVTNYKRGFKMTAANDERTGFLYLVSIALVGTGMTPAQRLTITDSAGGVVVDHYVENATENKEFLAQPRTVTGLKLSAVPAAGTWTVIAQFE